jgi:integrase
LRDDVAARVGRYAADTLVKNFNTLGRWYALNRTNNWVWPDVASPLQPGDRETKGKVLTRDKIKAIWLACENTNGPHGKLVQFLLLTTLRRNEAGQLHTREVAPDFSTLTIPKSRYKTKIDFTLPLSTAASLLLRSLARPTPGYFFSWYGGAQPLANYTRIKADIDQRSGVTDWKLHSLRHTGATLMGDAGVLPHVIEAVLGHKMKGIMARYQHQNMTIEKKAALEALATLLATIVR